MWKVFVGHLLLTAGGDMSTGKRMFISLSWCIFLLCVCVHVHWASLVHVFAMCLCKCAMG
jgi:hypothetical protein